ncbi:hypothetical protein ACVW17_002586 [Bradyrhizobium sp. USDA 4473]
MNGPAGGRACFEARYALLSMTDQGKRPRPQAFAARITPQPAIAAINSEISTL